MGKQSLKTARRKPELIPFSFERGECFRLQDTSVAVFPAASLLRSNMRDVAGPAATVAHQFLNQNFGILQQFGVESNVLYDGREVVIEFRSGSRVGAIPLLSPTSGRTDYGLVIQPRFSWSGLGPMMSMMGWRITPDILRLPLLPRSERSIPPWVLASMVLARLQAFLKQLDRKFSITEADMPAPKGAVDWERYAIQRIPKAQFLSIPCSYPDLRDDRDLMATIHFTLRKILSSLQTQITAGVVVMTLIDLCLDLINRVRSYAPQPPSKSFLAHMSYGNFRNDIFRDGLRAIEWTIEDRGLAGVSDMQGLPWVMSMETFFEAWVESVMTEVVRKIGGTLRSGRKRETVAPLRWTPSYQGSQKSFIPDIIVDRGDDTIIVDAKYKEHWEELQVSTWWNIEEEIRERHRKDIFQVLAYSSLADTRNIRCVLCYPCSVETWTTLRQRGVLSHRASIYAGERSVELILTAIPMANNLNDIVEELAQIVDIPVAS